MAIDNTAIEHVRECTRNKIPVFFSSNKVKIVFQTQILGISQEQIILANSIPPEYISAVVESQTFQLKIPSIRFVSNKLLTDGVHLILPTPDLHMIEDNRSSKRITFSQNEQVHIEVTNPIDGETMLSKTVGEMSSTGLSILIPIRSQLYTPGQIFNRMKIIRDGKLFMEVNASVVYQQEFLKQNGQKYCQVGFKFENPS